MAKITRQILTITPEMAANCLSKNPNNRHINMRWVNHLATLIKNGEFTLTHQGIAFDEDGNLIDGQHRLHAIIKAGIAVKMEVSSGWPRSNILAIDVGKKRNFDDRARFLGRDERRTDLAIAKILKYGPVNGTIKLSPDMEFNLIDEYRPGIDFASSLGGGHKKYYVIPVQAIVARASYTQDKARLTEFVKTLITGQMGKLGDQPAIKLRESIIAYRAAKKQLVRNQDFYQKCESALRAFIQERPITKLYPAESELFKIPGEM